MQGNTRGGFNFSGAPRPPGFTAVGIFLFFGALMATLAAISLIWKGTLLDRLWDFNPIAYQQLRPLGSRIGSLFFILGALLTTAGIGWFKHRLWGWRLAVAIIVTQVLGDVINCLRGDFVRGGIGIIIASAVVLFLLKPMRASFA